MLARELFVISTAVSAVGLACRSAVDHGGGTPGTPGLTIVSGNNQTGIAGETLASPLVVRLGDASGHPIGAATIDWLALGGGGTVSASSSVTDAEGLSSITWTLGLEGLAQEVRAISSSSPLGGVTFAATTTPTPNSTALSWTAAQLPAIPSCGNAAWSDIWAASETDVFAVGGCGTIRHFTGSSWEAQSSGTNHNLISVWGRSPSDVFAVGDSATVLHYDGTNWSEVSGLPLGVVNGIWGSQTADLFITTRDSVVKGHVWRYDGAAWTVQFNRMCPMGAIWGSSSSDIFVVGTGSPVRYDGISWTGGGCGALTGYYDVSGSGPGEVYVVGFQVEFVDCTRGGGCPRSAVVFHHVGTGWQKHLALRYYEPFRGVWVGSDGELVVVGASGLILHYDLLRWRGEPSGTSATIIAVTGNVPTSLWAITGEGLVLHGTRGP